MWQEECVEAVPLDGGDVRDAGFEMELSEKQLKLASVKQQIKLKFDSMALSLEVLTKQLEDSEAKNVKLEATNDALKTDLGTIELERDCLYTDVLMKNAVIKARDAEINSATLRNNDLVAKINRLTDDLASSQSALIKRKSELKKVKGKLVKTEKQHAAQVKDLKEEYFSYSKDLRYMTARCSKLRDQNDKLVPLPTPVGCRNFITMSKAHFEEGKKLLASAQSVAGGSAVAVFRACYERRGQICSRVAANSKEGDTNVYEIGMEATHTLLYEVWEEFTGMVHQNMMVNLG
jgi:cell division protein FtsB